MRVPVGFIKRVSVRLRRAVQGGRLERVLVRGRAVGRERLGRAVARGRATVARGRTTVVGQRARAVASSRLARMARERLGRTHVVGLVAGGGAAVALGVLSSLLGTADQSRAAADRPAPVARAASATASPTRFELTGDVARRRHRRPRRGGPAYYRRTTSRHVPSSAEVGFLPLYREAARTFGVSWQLIASIHRQETAFSTVAGTYHGLNAFGCCAGPMQFNVTNRPLTTWERYRGSFRLGKRPHRYPHRTRGHPSVYDDFDAIMAAGALLRDSGATGVLEAGAWAAAYAYYGHDRFGVGYASQVVARAQGWERDGFCLNCPEDAALAALLDDLYGVDARRELRAEERRRRHKKHKRHKTHDDEASSRTADKSGGRQEPLRLPARGHEAVATPPTPDPPPATTTTTPPPTTTTVTPPTPATPAPPAAKPCTPVTRLLGCRP
jgi:hypothetical protein